MPDGLPDSPVQDVAVARALLAAGALAYRPDEPVTFRSGLRSPVYLDCRRLIFQPAAWRVVIGALAERLRLGTKADAVAGVEAAGIPHSSALAYAASLPSVFVRKAPKEHGLGRRVEGGDVTGLNVVLVEDLVTTGSSSLSAVAALREAGATVSHCLAISTYGFGDLHAAFAEAGVRLEVLSTVGVVIAEALASDLLDAVAVDVIRDWLADPAAWVGP
ncbi:orotate phosphoribosyltransferase [soil metagenome]